MEDSYCINANELFNSWVINTPMTLKYGVQLKSCRQDIRRTDKKLNEIKPINTANREPKDGSPSLGSSL